MLFKKFFIVVDLGCFLIVSIVNVFLVFIIFLFRCGFFCNDDSIKYLFVNEEFFFYLDVVVSFSYFIGFYGKCFYFIKIVLKYVVSDVKNIFK